MAWISFGALPCGGKQNWWKLASRCCWNRARPWHASELVCFLVGLRTYQDAGIFLINDIGKYITLSNYCYLQVKKLFAILLPKLSTHKQTYCTICISFDSSLKPVSRCHRTANHLFFLVPIPCILYHFVQWPTNAQLFLKLSHCYMFRHSCVILREIVIIAFNTCTVHLLLFCAMTNKCTIISQIITLLHVSTLSCHPQGTCNQCF